MSFSFINELAHPLHISAWMFLHQGVEATQAEQWPMLVLSRRSGESIILGENTRVTVIWTRSGVVRLGITAPPEVHVRRAELPTEPSRYANRTLPMKQ